MTKYKLLKPIKNVEWNVGEVRETIEGYEGNVYIEISGCVQIYAVELALLEHAGFIEEVNDVQLETPKRWRAEKYSNYFYLNENFEVTEKSDIWGAYDNARYEAGNYFQTTEQVEEFRKGVKALVGSK